MPPDILNSLETSADESVTNEGGNVQLLCKATGVPDPRLDVHLKQSSHHRLMISFYFLHSVQWRREDGRDIVIRNEGREKQCNEF